MRRNGTHITEARVKEILNKKRLNAKRQKAGSKPRGSAQKRLRMMSTDDDVNNQTMKRSKSNSNDDDIDMNAFLLMKMTSDDKIDDAITTSNETHDIQQVVDSIKSNEMQQPTCNNSDDIKLD